MSNKRHCGVINHSCNQEHNTASKRKLNTTKNLFFSTFLWHISHLECKFGKLYRFLTYTELFF